MSDAATAARRAEPLFSPLVTLAVYGALTLAVLAPVFSVQVPCLGDYLNHLARIHILTTIGGSPALQRFYTDHWQLVPYYGMNLPVAALARVMPLYDAGRLFIGLCVLMPVLAAATLHYAVHRRISLVPALAFLLSYNYMLERGFLTYLFSAGLAVMLFAGWIATAEWRRWPRIALFAAAALLLYLSHAFAFAAYGILVGGYEVGGIARNFRQTIGAAAANLATAAAQALPVLALAVFGQEGGEFAAGSVLQFGSVWAWPTIWMAVLYFPATPWVTTACLFVPALGLPLLARTRLAHAVWPALLAIVLAACCVPRVLLNVWGADFRLPLVAAIVMIGALSRGPRLGRRLAIGVLITLAVLVLARSVDAIGTLRRLDAQVAQIRQVVATLPPGARLLVVDESEPAPLRITEAVMTWHIALVATIDRDAFVPFLFTGVTGVQPRPEVKRAASPNATPVTMAQLRDGFARRDPPEGPPRYGHGGTMYWLGWADKFDDVLLLHFGADMGPLPPVLHKVAAVPIADLYQVTAPRADRAEP